MDSRSLVVKFVTAASVCALLGTATSAAFAQTVGPFSVGVTVGAGQTVTNNATLTPNLGISFQGDGGTLNNNGTISVMPIPADLNQIDKIAVGSNFGTVDNPKDFNIPFNNLTINNSGTLQYTVTPGSGMFFAGNPIMTGGTQTGVTTVNGLTINNNAGGLIAGFDTHVNHDDVPLSLENGVNSATINNSGTISAAGGSLDATGIRIENGPSSGAVATNGITINNNGGGVIKNTGAGAAILLRQNVNTAAGTAGIVSNVQINNNGTIKGGQSLTFVNDPIAGNGTLAGAITIDATDGNSILNKTNITGVRIKNIGTSGSSVATINGSASGVAIDNSRNTAPLQITNNLGQIIGDIKFGSGGDTYQGTNGVVTGNIIGQSAAGESVTFVAQNNIVNGAITNVSTVAANAGVTTLSQGPTGFTQFNISQGIVATSVNLQSAFTQTGGTTTLAGGSTLNAPKGITLAGGTLGGNGTINGNVTVTGGTLKTGASPDPLAIKGNLAQTGGTMTFEIDPNGTGFKTSTLVVDKATSISITGANIVLDFVNGASSAAFAAAGDLSLDTFFKVSDGSDFGADFGFGKVFQGDTFSDNVPGDNIGGFDPGTGALAFAQTSAVPEPSSIALFLTALLGLGWLYRRKKV